MNSTELKPMNLYYSDSGKFAVEIKREDEKTRIISTVTFIKEGPYLQQIEATLSDSYDRVAKFLAQN